MEKRVESTGEREKISVFSFNTVKSTRQRCTDVSQSDSECINTYKIYIDVLFVELESKCVRLRKF